MTRQNEYQRGYEAAYDEIRAVIRDKNHPSVFVCPCPACEVIAELLQGLGETVNRYLTEDELELFQRLLRAAEDRHGAENWSSFVLDSEPDLWLDQKMIPE